MIDAALGVLPHDAHAVRSAIERARAGAAPDFEAAPGLALVALQNAFYQLAHADSLEQGLMATAAAGGDADSNAAVTGALLGALQGRQALPPRWMLRVMACRPCTAADAFRPRPMEYWPDDVPELAEALAKIA